MEFKNFRMLPSQLEIINCLDDENYFLIIEKLEEYFETEIIPSFKEKRDEVIFHLIVNEIYEANFDMRYEIEIWQSIIDEQEEWENDFT